MKALFSLLALPILALLGGSCAKDPQPALPLIADFTYQVDSTIRGERTIKLTNTSANAEEYVWTVTPQGGDVQWYNSRDLALRYLKNRSIHVTLTAKRQGQHWASKEQIITLSGIVPIGRVVFGKRATVNGDVELWVDGVYQGRITKASDSFTPRCGDENSITLTLEAGNHRFGCKIANGDYVDNGLFQVVQDECKPVTFF